MNGTTSRPWLHVLRTPCRALVGKSYLLMMIHRMLSSLKNQPLDIVIGSRYIQGGSTGHLSPSRVWISRAATSLSRVVLNQSISDPLSGFFMLRRSFFEKVMHKLSGRGFKILLDILVSASGDVRFR